MTACCASSLVAIGCATEGATGRGSEAKRGTLSSAVEFCSLGGVKLAEGALDERGGGSLLVEQQHPITDIVCFPGR